ncbi:hypothetical protein [Salisediminibacterium halotolerans]|uniref:Uncharacterized protein n=1 Tax=Salisediminibacterium halotolerans TaxID=517425 RepID=A0A1H9WZ18_9BACI|nr:hypothetical protein [Salisediminibacterium haloalkalitolerans]SES39150.1 hypothetical protein SAMN05444126_1672 [Salisediminibacterium haloalkalitolerans]
MNPLKLVTIVMTVLVAVVAGIWFVSSDDDGPERIPDESFSDSDSYDIYEDTGNPAVMFVYSDPTDESPGG